VAAWLGSLAGQVSEEGTKTAGGQVAEGQTQEILNGGPMLYTVPARAIPSGAAKPTKSSLETSR